MQGEHLYIDDFSSKTLMMWEEKSFKGNTQYQVLADGDTENSALRALSQASASGLFHRKRIDLEKTPYLNWRWKVRRGPMPLREDKKKGDDFAARVYAVVDGAFFAWQAKAISYVWSQQMLKGSQWPNAFAGSSVIMLSLQDAESPKDTWISEKRNLLEDLRAVHGKDIRYIDALAIMSDTDNTEGQAEAWYDDLYFSTH